MVGRKGAVLVIGIGGAIGGAAARAMLARGWTIRALVRDPAKFAHWPDEIQWVCGDALDTETVVAAAEGADIVFHGANPPMYRHWRKWGLPMLANSIAAAEQARARLVFPGNVYNFGPDAGAVIDEDSPQHPLTRKGAIRVEMEAMLRDASQRGRMRALVVRAGDFFGGGARGSWFAEVIAPAKPDGPIRYPGRFDVGHAWAYLPDLAEAMTRLIEIEASLPAWEAVHFGGHWVEPGVEMAEAVRRALGGRGAVRPLPWLPFRLLSPLSPFLRELLEMRYLWLEPLRLNNGKLVGLIGDEPHTPLDQAVEAAVAALGREL
ncbi:NAD-dependent epimerase/dehydratase family protein [Methylocystis heyeri]|uniref:NAD(P)H-binding protein n=1 Tax=Methylocystis heyeri TaxID=391905 RepID=A0A6B8KC53_9HYPH|nr:NAD-dependent epimerase/dehydratase family protein [Methylocystis heyeri]QGM44651.1 NAD(P)H-binding protein [Methylocystis heyeri]